MTIQYFKIANKPGYFVSVDDVSNRVQLIIKAELQQEKDELVIRIGTPDPNLPKTNAEWIAWAKEHYNYVDHSVEQTRLDEVNIILDALKAV